MDGQIVPDVVRDHAESAAFFWAQCHAIRSEDPPDPEAAEDARACAAAHLEGLRIAGRAAWRFVVDQMETYGEKGELFVAALLAIEQGDERRMRQVLRQAEIVGDRDGMRGALAWADPARTAALVRDWLGSVRGFERWLAVAALADHGADPGDRLARLLADEAPEVRAAACGLAVAAGRDDAGAGLRALTGPDEPPDVRRAAGAALVALGLPAGDAATQPLRRAALAGDVAALRLVVRAGPADEVRAWFAELLKLPGTAPVAVRGAGMLGDRSLLPWLIRQMRDPDLADAAGRAFRELYDIPRALWDDLSSLDPEDHGPLFAERFGDEMEVLPVADRIKAWALDRGIVATGG